MQPPQSRLVSSVMQPLPTKCYTLHTAAEAHVLEGAIVSQSWLKVAQSKKLFTLAPISHKITPLSTFTEIKSPLEGGKTTHTIAMVYYRASSSMQWLSCQRVLHKLISLALPTTKCPLKPPEAVVGNREIGQEMPSLQGKNLLLWGCCAASCALYTFSLYYILQWGRSMMLFAMHDSTASCTIVVAKLLLLSSLSLKKYA